MEVLGISVVALAVIAVAFVVGAAVQGVVGLGLGLVGAPVVGLVAPELMPVVPLSLAALLPMFTLIGERHDIDWRGLAWALPARIPGTWVGVLLVGALSGAALGVGVGLMVLFSVAITWRAVRVPINRGTLVAAGLASGITGTATSIGGPPLALLYQHRPATQIRTTLAVYFLLGALFSVVGLAWAGELPTRDLQVALLLAPAVAAGAWLGARLRGRVAEDRMRAAVLAVCAVSAVALLVKSLA